MSQAVAVVDDQPNGTVLDYGGDWTHIFGISSAVNGTVSYTIEPGATITFKFNGMCFTSQTVRFY